MNNEHCIAYKAMIFARKKHRDQMRKYTGNPYADHLAEVAGIVSTVVSTIAIVNSVSIEDIIAVCWLHDVMEDQGVQFQELLDKFGTVVSNGVVALSDMETGNRATRKALSRERLAVAPAWVQSIKCADLISNTSSSIKHDPQFARVYLHEKCQLLEVMTKADYRLLALANESLYLSIIEESN